ncbi:hypothetical protein DOTSEDRAFT_121305 [Dothistroma septosporum NZE10]|uniref:Uncharacterized protein n=1 Tax=Dothistroma septosporum (strain NZE10 / CBS 128990) TaxID=675120 RepID=N1Q3H6_DOTSN|nr:hypothetical protein DOTSEDRAFT_121305 [Dothistroma septosporum NZE10]
MDGDYTTTAASSVGSSIFAVTSIIAIALLALLVIRHYLPLRSTPGYLLVPVFLALALPCSIILLVPIDLASAAGDEETRVRGVWLPERVLLVAWRVTYWLTFMLTWFILPLLGEYCDSGYRDTRSRIIYSLRANARYQLIVLGTAVAGLVYFIWENGLHLASIKGLVMALAYSWGLILGLALMGHGLVALPRKIYRNASVSERLRRLQAQAPKVNDGLEEATDKLNELERTVMQLKRHKGGASSAQQEWIDELADTAILPISRPGTTAAIQATNPSIPAVVTDRYLADLTRKLKRARHRKGRFQDEWTNLCTQAQDTQTILDSVSSRKLDFGRKQPGVGGITDRLILLTPSTRYYLHASILPYLRVGVAGILGLASILIVWSELVKSLAPSLSVIGLTVVHASKVNFGGQLIAATWLLYMDASALYAISDVKVWGNRALVKRQTYAESATWYSLQVAKLTVPLSYNFITMMPPAIYKETMFFKFLGQLINLTPLGQEFSAFFPCFLIIPVLATLFNLYGKTKTWFGFGVLEDDSEDNPSGFGTGGWREGKALIDRELQARGAGDNVGREPYRDEGIREANRQFNAITNQEEDDSTDSARHFYQDFTERVRNTFETAEQPEWIRNLGSALKAPKWMQNDARDDNGGSALSKWFGGRPEDGRVRL